MCFIHFLKHLKLTAAAAVSFSVFFLLSLAFSFGFNDFGLLANVLEIVNKNIPIVAVVF